MTTDRLAALLHEALCGPFGFHDDPATATCGALAARLAAQGVTVGLDVARLAAALEEHHGYWSIDHGDPRADAAAIARAYAATPQPAEEEGR